MPARSPFRTLHHRSCRASVALVGVGLLTIACRQGADARSHTSHALAMPAASAATAITIASPAESVFAHDRQQGIDFRALGQEPGWSLTLDEGHTIVFEANSMDDSVVLPISATTGDRAAGTRTYEANADDHHLTLERVDEPCHDPINAIAFDAKVTVTFDGTTYQGCGKRL